jgi:hypothetical protein
MTSPASGVVGVFLLRGGILLSDRLTPYRGAGVQYPFERRSQDEPNVHSCHTEFQSFVPNFQIDHYAVMLFNW